MRLREKGHDKYPCIECTHIHDISRLLTGFTSPDQPLAAELEHVSNQLARIDTGITRMESQAAQTASIVRRMLRVVSSEITDCPSLFSLARERATLARRARLDQDHYRLTLWCEHPDAWHPWEPANYQLDIEREWFIKVSPYVRRIFKILQLAVPLAGEVRVASLPQDQIERAQAHLEIMTTLLKDLPSELPQGETIGEGDLNEAIGQLNQAEGDGLRALRVILFDHDRTRTFGGMRRVQSPSGDFLWVCVNHYSEYDPGLPVLP